MPPGDSNVGRCKSDIIHRPNPEFSKLGAKLRIQNLDRSDTTYPEALFITNPRTLVVVRGSLKPTRGYSDYVQKSLCLCAS